MIVVIVLLVFCTRFTLADSWQTQLNNDIWALNTKLNPSIESQTLRSTFLSHLSRAVKDLWPYASVHPFGSTVTGLVTSTSDTDVFITGMPDIVKNGDRSMQSDNRLKILARLKLVEEYLIQHEMVNSSLIIRAWKPLLRVRATDGLNHSISADISVQFPENAQTTVRTQHYIASDPVIVPVYRVIKTLLSEHDLNSFYTGGLRSYGIALMIAHFIQANHIDTRQLTASQVLLGFLRLYGLELDPSKTVLYLPTMDYLDRAHPMNATSAANIVIYCPIDLFNNVAAGTFRYHLIRKLFIETLNQLESGVSLRKIIKEWN